MRPRLQAHLATDRLREAVAPPLPREVPADVLDRGGVDEVGVGACVVCISSHRYLLESRSLDVLSCTRGTGQQRHKGGGITTQNRRHLQQLPNRRDRPLLVQILVPEDRLRHALRLLPRRQPAHRARPVRLRLRLGPLPQHLQRQQAAAELEAQPRAAQVVVRRPDVVQHARQEERLVREAPRREREAVSPDGEAEAVDAEAVVVGRPGQVLARVGLDASGERGVRGDGEELGDGDGRRQRRGRGVRGGGGQQGGGGRGDGGEAVGGDGVGGGHDMYNIPKLVINV